MDFGTRYGERVVSYSNSGSPLKLEYVAQYLPDGSLELFENGFTDLHAEIQSFKDECDIHLIMRRYAAGDRDVLSRVQGFFGDVTGVPNSYPEMFNLMRRSQEFFDGLPLDVKQRFGNSFEQFLSASQSPDFLSAFISSKVEEVPSTSEDGTNES